MSEALNIPAYREPPRRGRPPRAEVQGEHRRRRMTKLDDYDFVTTAELGDGFNPELTDSESNERVRMLVGRKDGGEPLYAYFLKKRRDYWEQDNQRVVENREDMMAGRIINADTTEQDEDRPGGEDKYYVPAGNQIGHAGERRRGRVPKTLT